MPHPSSRCNRPLDEGASVSQKPSCQYEFAVDQCRRGSQALVRMEPTVTATEEAQTPARRHPQPAQRTVTSTRRLLRRPLALSLDAAGYCSPSFWVSMREASMPCEVKKLATLAARCPDSSWFLASVPVESAKPFTSMTACGYGC